MEWLEYIPVISIVCGVLQIWLCVSKLRWIWKLMPVIVLVLLIPVSLICLVVSFGNSAAINNAIDIILAHLGLLISVFCAWAVYAMIVIVKILIKKFSCKEKTLDNP